MGNLNSNNSKKKGYILILILFLVLIVFIISIVSKNKVRNFSYTTVPVITGGANQWSKEEIIQVQKDAKLNNELSYYEYCIKKEDNFENCTWLKTENRNIKVAETGVNYIIFRAVDIKGNRSDNSNTEIVYIDNNNPEIIDIIINEVTATSISIHVNAQDNHSGIKKYLYSLDNQTYEEGQTDYTYLGLQENKEYTIYVKVEDNVGNITMLSMKVSTDKNNVEVVPSIKPTPTKKPDAVKDEQTLPESPSTPVETPKPTPPPSDKPVETPEPTPTPSDKPEEMPESPVIPDEDLEDDVVRVEVPVINLDDVPIVFREEENYKLPSYVSFGNDSGTYECLIDGDKYEDTKSLVEGEYKIVCTATSSKDVIVSIEKVINVKSKWDYTIGQAVTMRDGSKWHVLENSLASSDTVVLLSDYGINENGTYNTDCVEDQKYKGNYYMCSTREFDYDSTSVYDEDDSNNIGYFIKNTYAPLVQASLPGTTNVTLPTIEQILEADGQEYDNNSSYSLSSDWLLTNQYWINSAIYKNSNYTVSTYSGNIYNSSSNNYSSYIARPVITTLKSNIDDDYKFEVYDSTKSFEIGDAVTTIDGSKWHVLENSNSGDDMVVLLSDYNINKDGIYNKVCVRGVSTSCEFDYMAFDADGTNVYDEDDENNIGYLVKNKYEPLVVNALPGTINVTIPTAEQIGNALGIDYTVWYYQPISWINSTPYWTKTPSETQSNYTWKIDGGYGDTPYMWTAITTSSYSWGVRPVITTKKSNIIKYQMPVGDAKNTSQVDIGDYIYMKPTSVSYSILNTASGYSYSQTINPSELDLWRVIKKNSDGSIDVVSEYTSSKSIYIQTTTGYKNLVNTLQNIAASYTNSNYVLSTRHVGYNSQTPILSNTSFMNQNPPLWSTTTNSNVNESVGGGDLLYKNDVDLIKSAIGRIRAGNNNSRSNDTAYWLASRAFVYNKSTSWSYTANVISSNKVTFGSAMYSYNNGTFSSGSYAKYAIRPILTLKPNIEIVSGNGKDPSTPYSFE